MSEWKGIPHVSPKATSRVLQKVTHFHKFTGPECVEHLKVGIVYIWIVRKGGMTVCVRFDKYKGSKHIELSNMRRVQAGGEIKVSKKGIVYVNVNSGRYRTQDKRGKYIIYNYLKGQSKPVKLTPLKGLKDD
jgi:hypothetical protein